MNQKEICSFIQDLLPLYVEGLISEESKNVIDNHIKNCVECSEIIENIKSDNRLFSEDDNCKEHENSDREIKCIKKIKRRIVRNIIIAVIISIALTCGLVYVGSTYRIMKDESGRHFIYNINTGNIKQGLEVTNISAKYKRENQGAVIEYNEIFTFDKDDICISARAVISGYTENELNTFKNAWEGSIAISNIKIENEKIYMNDNVFVGKNKQQIIEILKTYNAIIMEI